MTARHIGTLRYEVKMWPQRFDDGQWGGITHPLGTILYADSFEELEAKLNRTITFFVGAVLEKQGLDTLIAYFNEHSVGYSLTSGVEHTPANVSPQSVWEDAIPKTYSQEVYA